MPDTPPATRSERRRHSKSFARRASTSHGLRARLGQLAVLPPCAVLLLVALSEYLLRSEPTWTSTRWLAAAVTVTAAAGLIFAAWRISRTTADVVHRQRVAAVEAEQRQRAADTQSLELRAVEERQAVSAWIARLRSVMADGLKEVLSTLDQLQRGEQPQVRELPVKPAAPHQFAVMEYGLLEFVHQVQTALTDGSARQERAAVLSIARRILTTINNTLKAFDDLEREMEDPQVLQPLFKLDHAVTRLRRLAESLTLAGGAPPRRSSKPMLLSHVIGHATSEIEQYTRVKLVSPVDAKVEGQAAPALVHAVAELLDNAATYSKPETQVQVRIEEVAAGVLIQIDDRGIPMPQALLNQMNSLLSEPSRHRAGDYLRDGRMGMWVVAEYARVLKFSVRLQTNFYGGNQAELCIPYHLFATTPNEQDQPPRPAPSSSAPRSTPHGEGPAAPSRADGRTATPAAVAPPASTRPVTATSGPHTTAGTVPPLPTRRASGEATPTPAAREDKLSSRAPGPQTSDASAQLPTRDKSRSYLAPQLQDSPSGRRAHAAPSAPPSANLMSQLADARRRADQTAEPDHTQHTNPTDPPHSLEAPRGDYGNA
ncbi:sensor histidine kinase [Streptomyces ardesiacus]|uniref:sensor histidine kinase n=1 Tax=Streptomyces ardesiacus TaxID=285564 RepID=UPI00364C71E7